MGIKFSKSIKYISDKDFHDLDYKVMGLAFQVHKELGKFWNEFVYRNYLIQLCKKNGLQTIDFEVPITLTFKNYIKRYYIDIIVNNSIIYELKSTTTISNVHKCQAFNYLLLAGYNHGKIINFGAASVESEFISTLLTPTKRYNYTIYSNKWINIDNDSMQLKDLIISLLNEWGAFLGAQLFYDAIYFFKGGKENVVRPIKIVCNDNVIGTQNFHLLNNKTAFNISALTNDKHFYRENLEKFLFHTPLETLQWINFNHQNIEFETIKNINL